jgi:hypothetical protein
VSLAEISDFSKDDKGLLKDVTVDIVVPKFVDADKGITIIDEYIYYATTSNNKDKYGSVKKNDIIFMRTKINGNDTQAIVTAVNFGASKKFGFYKIDGVVYLAYDLNGEIFFVKIEGKKISKPESAVENVEDSIFAKPRDYDPKNAKDGKTVHGNYIYFTRKPSESEQESGYQGTSLGRIFVGAAKYDDQIIESPERSITLKAFENDVLYYFVAPDSLGFQGILARELIFDKDNPSLPPSFPYTEISRANYNQIIPTGGVNDDIVARNDKEVYVIRTKIVSQGATEKTAVKIFDENGSSLDFMGLGFYKPNSLSAPVPYLYYVNTVQVAGNFYRLALEEDARPQSISTIRVRTAAPYGFAYIGNYLFAFENNTTRNYMFLIDGLRPLSDDNHRLMGIELEDDIIEN